MGNSESGSYNKRLSVISPEEQSEIEQSFEKMPFIKSGSKKSLNLKTFQDYLGNSLPSFITRRIFRGIQSINLNNKSPIMGDEISKEQYLLFFADILRGTSDEKSWIMFHMINLENSEQVKGEHVQQFLKDLITAVLHVLKGNNVLSGWKLEKVEDSSFGIQALALHLLSQLKTSDGQTIEGKELLNCFCSRASIEEWLYKVPMISTLLRVVLTLGLSVLKQQTDYETEIRSLVPKCRVVKQPSFVSLLDLPSVMFLNYQLPSEMQQKWRLLFSSQIHGESFSKLCGHLVDQGPSLLVLKDSDGFIFGGFASQNWEVKPQFQGDSRCVLFSIFPHLNVYTYTGYNDHYMYLNHGQQTMPNGLGMGGQHNYFGLWIDSNFGSGHSKAKPSCTTYNSPQLSAKEEFTIDAIEVWAVGELSEELVAKNKKSILDADPEARALLDMTGKGRQSEGLRDKSEDDDM
ncbi:MTOR-associated protein MEAK7 [Bombina bombina]|uniref:MTOR-associated protein MEAK7 n=1 Tax=Bombina bombina TaxID=8345 RepID=UPI00235A50D9|nr:MTOR-associated protein MEAK7 [Bombina bombina]